MGYPRELEEAHRQKIFIGIVAKWKHRIIMSQLNDEGDHTVDKFSACNAKAQRCCSTSTTHSIDLTKTDSGCGADIMPSRIHYGTDRTCKDPEEVGGALSVLDETMEALELDEEAMNSVHTMINRLSWSTSRRMCSSDDYTGDPVLAGDRLLNMGSLPSSDSDIAI